MKNKGYILSVVRQIANLFLIILLVLLVIQANAKSFGRFSKYTQVTDKQVLIETSKGIKVLFTAYDNQSIGVEYFGKKEECKLISPANIKNHIEFAGSIYVEEIDELMQITSTSKNGIKVNVNKGKCAFTFIDKTTQKELLLDEEMLVGIFSNKQIVSVSIDTTKQISYVAHPKL